jgi:tetratricopeptide (TPR) repeat protein
MQPIQEPVSQSAEPYDSLSSLRAEHIAKMRAAQHEGRNEAFVVDVRNFIARVKATGRRLESSFDREIAQNVIAYWASYLFKGDEQEALSATLPPLDPFDPARAPVVAHAENPYKGLSAFDETDAQTFYGREGAISELVDKLRAQSLVFVVGSMGSGKTSFVAAGVAPRLESRMISEGLNPVRISFIPGADPFAALLIALRTAAANTTLDRSSVWIVQQKKRLESAPERLRDLCETLLPGRPVILVVDQFEDIFTSGVDADVREKFAKAVVSACSAGQNASRAILIVDKHSESSALQLAAFKPFANIDSRFTLPPLNPDSVRRIVENAAKTVGLEFDDGIVDDIVKDIGGDPGALPALQFTLGQLWDKRTGYHISWDVYNEVGRPHEALQRTAEGVYSELTPSEKEAARKLFLELVHPTVEGNFTRRRISRETVAQLGFHDEMARILERYVNLGLIRQTPGAAMEDDRFEVAHEALVRNWLRLSQWLHEESSASDKKLQLIVMARRWRESGAEPGYLLSGAALEEAEDFAGSIPELRDFVAESKKVARLEDKRKRRLQIITVAVLGGLVAATVFFWLEARIEAEKAKIEAENLQLSERALRAIQTVLSAVSSEMLEGSIKIKAAKDLLPAADEAFAAVVDRSELSGMRAEVAIVLSDVNYLSGENDKALEYAELVKNLALQRIAQDPGDQDWRPRLYQASFRLGDLQARRKNNDAALREYQLALQLANEFAAAVVPPDAEKQRNIAFIENKVGDIYYLKGQWDPSFEHYHASRSIGEQLTAVYPDDPKAQKVVGDARKRLGDLFAWQKRFTEAVVEYEAALNIQKALVEKDPDNDVYQSNLSRSHHQLGELYKDADKPKEALQEYENALQIRKRLARKDPDNADWQSALANESMSIGNLTKESDPNRAINNFRAALMIREELVSRSATNNDWQLKAAASHTALAGVLSAKRQVEEAVKEYNAAAAIQKHLVEEHPDKPSFRVDLANCYAQIGDAYKIDNRVDAALAEYRKALKLRDELVANDPGNMATRLSLASLHMAIANALSAHDATDAIEHYRKALLALEPSSDTDSFGMERRLNVAELHGRLATLLLKQHMLDAAVAEARTALQGRLELLGQSPGNRDRVLALAVAYGSLGDALAAQSGPPGARQGGESVATYRKGLEIVEEFLRAHPDKELEQARDDLRKRAHAIRPKAR